MPRERNLQSIAHPNQKHGAIYQYKNGLGNQPIVPTTAGDVLTVQADGTSDFETPTPVQTLSVQITRVTGATWTKPAGFAFGWFTLIGAGGGGGGTDGGANPTTAAGGGGGGASRKFYLDAELSGTESVTQATGGTAGSSGGGNGGAGSGTASFKSQTATPGTGGTGDGSVATTLLAPGRGGTATGGNYNFDGHPGDTNFALNMSGRGGASGYGGPGGTAVGTGEGNGVAGTDGGGGSGANSQDATNHSGGAGGASVLIVEEWILS